MTDADLPLSREQVEAIRDKYADKLEDVMWKRLCNTTLALMDRLKNREKQIGIHMTEIRALTEERDHYALAVEVAAEIMTTQQVAEATKRQAQRRAALEAEE